MRVAVIPARGGSKRIPGKNIRPFLGKPVIAYSIEAALASGLFDHVIVSTDDPAIAEVARATGATTPFERPEELADDHTTVVDVVTHAVRWMLDQQWSVDAVCCIYATAPFIDAGDLCRGAEELASGRWDYAFAVTDFPAPIFRAFSQLPEGGVEMFFPEHFGTRSQDLPVALHDAGQFCWGTPDAWLSGEPIFGPRSFAVVIPRWRVQDIDTAEDWTRAELMFEALGRRQRNDGR
jgi:N-acylneuraminate cytidylyltransferase